VHRGANKVPLVSAEMPRSWNKCDPLIEIPQLKAKPTFIHALHICRDDAARNLTPIVRAPPNAVRARSLARPYQSLSAELVEVEFQPLIKTYPLSWYSMLLRPCVASTLLRKAKKYRFMMGE